MDRQASARIDLECMLTDETREPRALPLPLLEDITKSFSADQEIGRGGFAVVYKVRKYKIAPVLLGLIHS